MAEAANKEWSLDSEGKERRLVADSWYIGETLGKGGFGFVKMGYHKKNGKPFALKFIRKADSDDPQAKQQAALVATEINCLIRVQNPYVLKLFAYRTSCIYPQQSGENLNTIMLVLELARGGDLFDILYYTKKLKLRLARTYFYQLAEGLQAIHAAGICHRDLKPQNLLLNSKFEIKITDFGLSKIFEDPKNQKKVMKTYYAGTQGYQAPEQILKRNFTPKCDVFSCGVILFILLTGYPPCHNAHYSDPFYKYIAQVQYDKFWLKHRLNKTFDDETRDIMNKTLCYQPTDRFTAKQMLEHPFTQNEKARMGPSELQRTMKVLFTEAMEKKSKDDKKVEKLKGASKLARDIVEFGDLPLWGDRVLPRGRSYALVPKKAPEERLQEIEEEFKQLANKIKRDEHLDEEEKSRQINNAKALRESQITLANQNQTARSFLEYLDNLAYVMKGSAFFIPEEMKLKLKVKLTNLDETIEKDDIAEIFVYKKENTGVVFAVFEFPNNFGRHVDEAGLYETMAGDKFPRWFRRNLDKETLELYHTSALQNMDNNDGELSIEFKEAVMNNTGCTEAQYKQFEDMCVGTSIEFELPTMSEWLIPRCHNHFNFDTSLLDEEAVINYDDLQDFFNEFNQQDEMQPKKERDDPAAETHGYVLKDENEEPLPLGDDV